MKCFSHPAEAVGVCAYCGRGLCAKCAKPGTDTRRLVCSGECADALTHDDAAMNSILQKSVQSARASSYYSYLCAVLSGGGGHWRLQLFAVALSD